jgi:hypothetical protein
VNYRTRVALLGALRLLQCADKHAMPDDRESSSRGPQWVPSPVSPVPLQERAAAKKAAADTRLREESRRALHEAYDRAVLKVYAKPKVHRVPGHNVLARCLRSLRRTGKRQDARDLLRLFKTVELPGRPKADEEHYELAKKIHAEFSKLRKERSGGHIFEKEVMFNVARSTGKSQSTLRRAWKHYGPWVEAREEARVSLEEMSKNRGGIVG